MAKGPVVEIFTNADVNKMTKAEIIRNLRSLNLSTWYGEVSIILLSLSCSLYSIYRGAKEVIAKRLKDFCRSRKVLETNRRASICKHRRYDRYYDFLCVLDFECTCVESRQIDFPHEIIEFPVILLSTASLKVVSQF